MKISKILKLTPLLAIAGILSFKYKKKSYEESYETAQKYSLQAIKQLGYQLVVTGIENLPKQGPLLFFSNHQGTLDPAVVVGACPLPLSFVSKKENEKIPVLGRWARNIGTIHFDRETREGNITMIRSALRRLKEGKNLLIFPEGTRSKCDAMVPFKSGSLQVALMSKVDIVPVTLNNAYCIDVNSANKTISIHFGEIIKYDDYKDLSGSELEQLVYNRIHDKITVF